MQLRRAEDVHLVEALWKGCALAQEGHQSCKVVLAHRLTAFLLVAGSCR